MTIETASLYEAVSGERQLLERQLYDVITETIDDDPGIEVTVYGPEQVPFYGDVLEDDQLAIDDYVVDSNGHGGYDIRVRASYDRMNPASPDSGDDESPVDVRVVYKLDLSFTELIYSGEVTVFVLPLDR